jgi:hypothetical protein
MEALTIHPQNKEQLEAIKSVLKALNIPFNKKESPYNTSFVKKIQEAEQCHDEAVILNSEEDISNYFKDIESDVQD